MSFFLLEPSWRQETDKAKLHSAVLSTQPMLAQVRNVSGVEHDPRTTNEYSMCVRCLVVGEIESIIRDDDMR